MILHFAVCSFDTFWSKRWAALGYASPNHRFRGGGAGLDQRANAPAFAERRDEAEAFYRRSMMVSDEHEKQRQLKAGVCIHLDARQLVEAARLACLSRMPWEWPKRASGLQIIHDTRSHRRPSR